MTKLFNSFMQEQPEILAAIAAGGARIAAPLLAFCEEQPERIFLLGSGSSYNAAFACADLIRKLLRVEVTCITPTLLPDQPLPDGLVLALSQSGTSTSTFDVVRKLQQEGRKVLLLTAQPDSLIGNQADACVLVECGPEPVGPKTKGATATMMTLLVCMLELAKAHGTAEDALLAEVAQSLQAVSAQVAEALASGAAFFAGRDDIAAMGQMMLVADAKGYGAGLECALKLLETCWLPVFLYEFEEFMHGIHYAVGQGSNLLFLLPKGGPERVRMLRLAGFAADNGAASILLDTDEGCDGAHLIVSTNEITRPFALVAFFQALCGPLSQARGINCDIPRYPEFGKIMDTKRL